MNPDSSVCKRGRGINKGLIGDEVNKAWSPEPGGQVEEAAEPMRDECPHKVSEAQTWGRDEAESGRGTEGKQQSPRIRTVQFSLSVMRREEAYFSR